MTLRRRPPTSRDLLAGTEHPGNALSRLARLEARPAVAGPHGGAAPGPPAGPSFSPTAPAPVDATAADAGSDPAVAHANHRHHLGDHTHALTPDVTGAGTAAAKNVPASGDAASGEVVLGADTRLTDSRPPTTHTHTHASTTGQTTDDHHAKAHGHSGADGSGTVAHSATTGQTTDDHHAKSHGHTGSDGSGTVAYSTVTGTPTIPAATGSAPADTTVGSANAGSITSSFTRPDHQHHIGDHDHSASGSGGTTALSAATGTISDTQHGARGGGTLHSAASPSVAGFLSAADKTRINQLVIAAAKTFTVNNSLTLTGVDSSTLTLTASLTTGAGTSFPTSPASGWAFFRTDLGVWCSYDGTQWVGPRLLLPFVPATATGNVLTSTGVKYRAVLPQDYLFLVKKWTVTLNLGATNDGSNYWAVDLRRSTGSSATAIAAVGSSAQSPNTYYTPADVTSFSSQPVAATRFLELYLTKTGTAAALEFEGAVEGQFIYT